MHLKKEFQFNSIQIGLLYQKQGKYKIGEQYFEQYSKINKYSLIVCYKFISYNL